MKKWTENPSTHFLEQVLESSRDLIFVKNNRFEIVYANKAFLEIYSPEKRNDIIGHTTVESFTEDEAELFLAKDRAAFATGHSQAVEQITDYQGRKLTLVTKKTRFIDDEGIARILGVAADVSDLVEQTRKLSESNRTLEKFATLAAHDMASPLGTASLMLQMLAIKAGIREDAVATAAIGEVVDVLQGSSTNITSVLILQKAILTGALERQVSDLRSIAEQVKARLKAALEAASARVEIAELPVVACHPILLEALFQNLLENSVKYRSTDNALIVVSATTDANGVVISVSDNGVGVDSVNAAKMFDVFQQGDQSQPGLGVGLGLCRGIVEAHGGLIWIDRTYRDGTKVCFTLERSLRTGDEAAGDDTTEGRPSRRVDNL